MKNLLSTKVPNLTDEDRKHIRIQIEESHKIIKYDFDSLEYGHATIERRHSWQQHGLKMLVSTDASSDDILNAIFENHLYLGHPGICMAAETIPHLSQEIWDRWNEREPHLFADSFLFTTFFGYSKGFRKVIINHFQHHPGSAHAIASLFNSSFADNDSESANEVGRAVILGFYPQDTIIDIVSRISKEHQDEAESAIKRWQRFTQSPIQANKPH